MRTTQSRAARTRSRSASRRFTDRALILRRFRYGESSLVVHVLTPEHGRLAILAKGAYRAKSGYCGVLDLFDTLELGWNLAPRSDLGTLRSAAIGTRRQRISRQLGRYQAGLSMLEIAGLGAREGHEERELFHHLTQALDTLHEAQVDPTLACAAFDLCFLQSQGLAPALERCAACGQQPPGERKLSRIRFSHAMGGRICSDCSRQAGPAAKFEELAAGTLRMASSLQNTPFSQLSRIRLDSVQANRLGGFLRRFLEYHLETRPRVAGPLSVSP